MNRFRPNLVVAGAQPYGEDQWDGDVGLRVVKPCARCLVTTTDESTTVRGKEPLRTLATYRNTGGKVMFGQNVVHEKEDGSGWETGYISKPAPTPHQPG